MGQIVAVFASDTHLSEATWTSRAQVRGDSFFGFQQVVDLAIANRCPLVLAGDCWELMHQSRPSSVTVEFVRGQLDRLKFAGCEMYFINGQHDQLASPFWFNAVHDWPQHVGQREFTLAGMRWFGLDFFEVARQQQAFELIPAGVEGVVLHQQWREFTDSKFLSPMTLTDVPHGRLLISGDMHQTIVDSSTGRTFVSPGATHMRSLAEPELHNVIVIRSGGEVRPYAIKSRPVLHFVINDAAQMYSDIESVRADVVQAFEVALAAGVPAEVAKPLLVVEDFAGCEAEQVIVTAITEAHVVSRRVKQQGRTAVETVTPMNDQVDVRDLFMRIAVARDPLNHARTVAMRALVYGEDPAVATLTAVRSLDQ